MHDVHGDRSTTTAEHVQRWRRRRSFSFLSFGFLHLVVVASSLLALSSGSLLLSERMTVLVSFSRQSHTGVLQLLEPFFTGSRSEEEGAEAHGPQDRPSRRRVVLLLSSPLELPAIRLEGILLLTPSLVGLLLQYTPESTTNWPETKAIEHAPPFSGHEQGAQVTCNAPSASELACTQPGAARGIARVIWKLVTMEPRLSPFCCTICRQR